MYTVNDGVRQCLRNQTTHPSRRRAHAPADTSDTGISWLRRGRPWFTTRRSKTAGFSHSSPYGWTHGVDEGPRTSVVSHHLGQCLCGLFSTFPVGSNFGFRCGNKVAGGSVPYHIQTFLPDEREITERILNSYTSIN